ncbi:hypothetical protein WG66_008919, partial [Moniliophthora roreri]
HILYNLEFWVYHPVHKSKYSSNGKERESQNLSSSMKESKVVTPKALSSVRTFSSFSGFWLFLR